MFFFIVIISSTLLRSYITNRGIFWILNANLFILLTALLFAFDKVILQQANFQTQLLLLQGCWAFPEVGISVNFDCLSYLFILLVTAIGLGTNIYILNYFKNEANEDIFTLFINWFILSMILLVLANNFFTLFLGWELIGLTSFFLINFWTMRRGTLKSSFKAFSFNKASDFFLFLFIILVWFLTGKSSINLINTDIEKLLNCNYLVWYTAAIFLILCSSIKSAQIVGHLWLPDSMEAPVPASALIHSATLVSAGVYLLLRFNGLIEYLNLNWLIMLIGAITAAYGGVVASAQTDVKKLLAYSTVSHCGFLFVCTSLGNHYLVVIYLFLHGLFKALTFFCVGSLIRVAGSQDTRQMGVLSRYLPVDTIFLIISASNLGGLPFTLGYLYKNLFMIFLVNSFANMFVVGLCFIGMLSSLVYVFRLVYFSAFDIVKSPSYSTSKLLQDNVNVDKNLWSFSTIIQSLTVLLVLSFTTYIYVLFYNYFSFSNLVIDQFPLYFSSQENFIKENEYLYNFYINFFYSLYIIVIFILILIECRKSYTWQKKMHFIVYFLFFTFTLLFLFTI